MATTLSTSADTAHSHQRKPSVTALEFRDASGRRGTIHLDELADDDRELAEKFGYNPVRLHISKTLLSTLLAVSAISTKPERRSLSANSAIWPPSPSL
jgi:hypothetical protein